MLYEVITADVNALGGEVMTYQVTPRPNALQAYDLTIDDLESALARNNRNAGGGQFQYNVV